MPPAVIFGTTTFGRLARRYLDADSDYDVVAYTVPEVYLTEPDCDGLPVVPFEALEEHHAPGTVEVLVAVGYTRVNRVRAEIAAEATARGYKLLTYVSSDARVWPGTPVGAGSFLFEGVLVQPGATIGENVVVWSGTAINHDTTIGDHCFVASNVVLSGGVTLGHHAFVGANATFRDDITVGAYAVIGAGATILHDVAERAVHAARHTPSRGDDSLGLERI